MKLFLIDLSKSKLATSIRDPDLKLDHGQVGFLVKEPSQPNSLSC